jgi:hypothetical protein
LVPVHEYLLRVSMFTEQTILDWLFKGFVGVLTWLGIRLHNRVDNLEKDKVSVETLSDLKEQMAEHRKETQANFQELRTLLIHRIKDENFR